MANTNIDESLVKLKALTKVAERAKAAIDAVSDAIPTKVSQLTNDSGYQTASDVNSALASQISRVYKPSGTVDFASLPVPAAELLGNVYNVSDAFTTTNSFVEGAGKSYPAGTNVAVVQVDSEYKLDALSGAVDLSNYVEKEAGKGLSTNDFTNDYKSKLDGVSAGATKTAASSTAGHITIDGTDIEIVSIASDSDANAAIEAVFPSST